MSGILNIPKFVDFRNKIKRHPTKKYSKRSLSRVTTIAIHHSLTRQNLSGSNAEGYARYHVDTHGWPSIGYHYVIEPDGTVKFCNDLEYITYHVGDHNGYTVGICVTGDFRYEELTPDQKESLRNVVRALQSSYPQMKHTKGHNEFSGYEWKPCPVFDYKAVLGAAKKPAVLPDTYVIQQGDTFWSIAKGLEGVTVDDLLKANPGVDPRKLQIGQVIRLRPTENKNAEKKPSVKTYTLVTNVSGYYYAADAKNRIHPKNTVIKGTYYIFKEADGMINVTTKPGIPGSWINPQDNVIKSSSPSSNSVKVGQKVRLKSSAAKYATGQTIPSKYKGKTYTVMQVKSDRVLLKELYSWVLIKDIEAGSSTSTTRTFKTGDKVKLKTSAKKYATGETIPTRYKGKNYTIQQVKTDRVLLKELYSWVYKADIE